MKQTCGVKRDAIKIHDVKVSRILIKNMSFSKRCISGFTTDILMPFSVLNSAFQTPSEIIKISKCQKIAIRSISIWRGSNNNNTNEQANTNTPLSPEKS
jgi:hypothetical protein